MTAVPIVLARIVTAPLELPSALLLVVAPYSGSGSGQVIAAASWLVNLRWSLYLLLTTGEWP